MSHPTTIPSNYARTLQEDLDSGRVTDGQKIQHFERLVAWAAWLEEETEIDTIEALRMYVRELERENRELENANKKLKEERKTRRARGKETIRRGHVDRYNRGLTLSREAQEERCWEQRAKGDVVSA